MLYGARQRERLFYPVTLFGGLNDQFTRAHHADVSGAAEPLRVDRQKGWANQPRRPDRAHLHGHRAELLPSLLPEGSPADFDRRPVPRSGDGGDSDLPRSWPAHRGPRQQRGQDPGRADGVQRRFHQRHHAPAADPVSSRRRHGGDRGDHRFGFARRTRS